PRELHAVPTRRSSDLRLPDRSHFRAGVTGDHERSLRFSEAILVSGVGSSLFESRRCLLFWFRMVLSENRFHFSGSRSSRAAGSRDRKSTRLNSSHVKI